MGINYFSRITVNIAFFFPAVHFLVVVVAVTTTLTTTASAAESASSYYWWNGPEKMELDVIPDYLIEFPSPTSSDEKSSDQLKILSVKKLFGGAKLIQVGRSDFERALVKNGISPSTSRSPLFRQGSDLKALPGGVILTFNSTVMDSEAQGYIAQQGLILVKKISLEGQPLVWLVQAASGLASLKLANSLHESHSKLIEKVQPHFWQPIDTRELRSIQLNPKRSIRYTGVKSGKSSTKKVYKSPYKEQP